VGIAHAFPSSVLFMTNSILLWWTLESATLPPEANFHFRSPRLFHIGAVLEGSQRLMSYKLAPHVLVTFTEQVVPIYKHITLF